MCRHIYWNHGYDYLLLSEQENNRFHNGEMEGGRLLPDTGMYLLLFGSILRQSREIRKKSVALRNDSPENV